MHPDEEGNFFMVACHDYDQYLDVIYSEPTGLKDAAVSLDVKFHRNIEPNIMNVLDMDIR